MKTVNNLLLAVIGVLVAVILLQRCEPPKERTVYLPSDTVYKTITDTQIIKVPIYKSDTIKYPGDTIFIGSSDCEELLDQYNDLANRYATRNIYKDTIPVEEYGYITITDTTHYNRLCERKYVYNLRFPEIISQTQKRQFFLGGEITMQYPIAFNHIQTSLLYKDRKNRMFGITVGVQHEFKPYFGISSYWKL